jgi:hypothetical protein
VWFAPHGSVALDDAAALPPLRRLVALGADTVAIGHDVVMPRLAVPELEWGQPAEDARLRRVLRRIGRLGMRRFLLPRIESPEFFAPPYPFRADIRFPDAARWERFHAALERMVVHYARLAQAEGVELLGLGLELKHSVLGFPERWRAIIAAARREYSGPITYSANWYEEWREVAFWGELDYIGIGAYFELAGAEPPGTASAAALVGRWQPILAGIEARARQIGRPVLFTEVGYPGFRDCAERPWEWAGKAARGGVAIDHAAQARAWQALLQVVEASAGVVGLFAWSAYTTPAAVADWEYGILDRPAEAVLRRAWQR